MEKAKANDPEVEKLLMKCIEGLASSNDYEIVWNWIHENEQHKTYYENLRNIYLAASVFKPIDKENTAQSWIRFKSKHLANKLIPKSPLSFTFTKLLRIAAIFILAFIVGGLSFRLYLNYSGDSHKSDMYLVEAPRGAKSFVALPDGTNIWLNAGSKISYQRDYNQQNRKVFLEGEAYFQVAKNKKIPFYVYSSGLAIKAIGTSFNVKAYPDEDIIETTLVEGVVSIESIGKTGKKEKIMMEPNQKISFYKASENLQISRSSKPETLPAIDKTKIEKIEVDKKVDTELYTSWKDKRWIFKKQNLSDFAVILERLYDIKIVFEDDELRQFSLTGSFDEENLEQVLKALQLTIPLEYSINHRDVTFSINKSLKNNYNKLLKSSKNN